MKKVKGISTKRLTKDLRNTLSILNGAKYFSSGLKSELNVIISLLGLILGNIIECQKFVFENIAKPDINSTPTSWSSWITGHKS